MTPHTPIEEVLKEVFGILHSGEDTTTRISAKELTKLINQRDQSWLKRIEEIVPEEQEDEFGVGPQAMFNFGFNACRKETLNKIKTLKH